MEEIERQRQDNKISNMQYFALLTSKVLIQSESTGFLGSSAACKSHILILPSYAPLTILLLSNLIHLKSDRNECSSREKY